MRRTAINNVTSTSQARSAPAQSCADTVHWRGHRSNGPLAMAMPVVRGRALEHIIPALVILSNFVWPLPANADCEPEMVARLIAADAGEWEGFGQPVAISGDTVLVSEPIDDQDCNDPYGCRYGSVYVFTRDALGMWTEQAKLTASDRTKGDEFGGRIAISGDTAVIAAPESRAEGIQTGSAYIFSRDRSGVWTQQAKLTASDAAGYDHFGNAVAISGDTVIIGAHRGDTPTLDDTGVAYVFQRDGAGTWTERNKLFADDAVVASDFGAAVAISGDTAIISAPHRSVIDLTIGPVYVFTRDGAGTWAQQAKLLGADTEYGDIFGVYIAISGDTAVVGAQGDNATAGSAYVFARDAAGRWTEEAKLIAADVADVPNMGFGVVAIDGDTVVVGTYGTEAGVAGPRGYVFQRDSDGVWGERAVLGTLHADARVVSGFAVAVSGTTTVLGSALDVNSPVPHSGAAYLFDLSCLSAAGDDTPIVLPIAGACPLVSSLLAMLTLIGICRSCRRVHSQRT